MEPAMTAQQRVREFHEKFGLAMRDEPQVDGIPPEERAFIATLICEEFAELLCSMYAVGDADLLAEAFRVALVAHRKHAPTLPFELAAVAREKSDVLAVVYGCSFNYGYDLDAAFVEVMAACMRKVGADGEPIKRADGKVLKPEGWEPPNVARAIGLDVTNPRGNDGLEGPGSDRNAGADRGRVEEGSSSAGAPGGGDGRDVAAQGARRSSGRADQGAQGREGAGLAPRPNGRVA